MNVLDRQSLILTSQHLGGAMDVLITGASGFVGRALCRHLVNDGLTVHGVVRTESQKQSLPDNVNPIVMKSIDDLAALDKVGPLSAIVHLAARVHQMRESSSNPLDAFRAVNTRATAQLARWSALHGVKRFVFLSSIKVNGEGQKYFESPHVYCEHDPAMPEDPYGLSKWEAEQELRVIADQMGLETVILRPTLIYGPHVRANFLQLLKFVRSGIPLPLGATSNMRSLLYLGNLLDAIRLTLTHPMAVGETFLVSDGEDMSTPELIREIARAMQRSARLIAIPPKWLDRIGRITRTSATVNRLLGTLQIDSSKLQQTLGWKPAYTAAEGVQATVDWFLQRNTISQGTRRIA